MAKSGRNNIGEVLARVDGVIDWFLDELDNIYEVNQIDFHIRYLKDALVRMLTPFQLHSQANNHGQTTSIQNNIPQSKNIKQMKPFHWPAQYPDLYKTTMHDLKLIPSPNQEQQKQDRRKRKRQPQYTANGQKIQITRPVLKRETQAYLVQWVMQRLRQNKRTYRKDIAKMALKMSGEKVGFMGSAGWVNRFLNRHPLLKEEYKKKAQLNVGFKYRIHAELSDDESAMRYAEEIRELQQEDSGVAVRKQEQEDLDKSQQQSYT